MLSLQTEANDRTNKWLQRMANTNKHTFMIRADTYTHLDRYRHRYTRHHTQNEM